MKYEVIIFDADNTLFDFNKSEKNAFKNTMLEFNIDYEENYHFNIYKEINNIIWKELEDGLISQKDINIERFRRFSLKIDIKFDEKEFAQTYLKKLSESSILYSDSLEIVKELYKKNYRLCILTNGFKFVQEKRIKNSKLGKFFEEIVISEEVKMSKPDSRIFDYVLKLIKIKDKDKVLMLGDSLTSDIKGGINSGIDTCWFNPDRKLNTSGLQPTYEIHNLLSIKKIV